MDIPHPIIGSYPVRTGNAVRPLVDGPPAFRGIGEVIDRARHSVWLTVAFYTPDFRMPDGRGSLFDVLDRAVARGLDVRVIFWRPNPECPWGSIGFHGLRIKLNNAAGGGRPAYKLAVTYVGQQLLSGRSEASVTEPASADRAAAEGDGQTRT